MIELRCPRCDGSGFAYVILKASGRPGIVLDVFPPKSSIEVAFLDARPGDRPIPESLKRCLLSGSLLVEFVGGSPGHTWRARGVFYPWELEDEPGACELIARVAMSKENGSVGRS